MAFHENSAHLFRGLCISKFKVRMLTAFENELELTSFFLIYGIKNYACNNT